MKAPLWGPRHNLQSCDGESGGTSCPFIKRSGINQCNLVAEREGELSEWSKEPHSKCGIRITSYRGFESLTLRKEKRTICLSEFTQASKSLFFSLNKVPAAACWVSRWDCRRQCRCPRIPVRAFSTPDRRVLISLRSNDYCLRQFSNPSHLKRDCSEEQSNSEI